MEARNLVHAIDEAEGTGKPAPAASAPSTELVNQEPIPGVDLGPLDDKKKERFYRLVDRDLQSPCGKPHSLRKSITSDESCKRALFAARYVVALLEDEGTDKDVRKFYENHYKEAKIATFKLDSVPFSGPRDAPVQLVEFYDYGCPACKEFAAILKEVLEENTNQVVLFYKQFPLPVHPNSRPAAQAALAASRQGPDKFHAMHDELFAKPDKHQKSDLMASAQSLGLNMARFQADYEAAAARVQAEIDEGDALEIHGTPTLFINGRPYDGPMHPRYLQLWIDEEVTVNR